MDPMEQVEVMLGFAWDCPGCGKRNAQAMAKISEAETDQGGLEGEWCALPETLTCERCLRMYEPRDPVEDERDEAA